MRMFPIDVKTRTGNCEAGTVLDHNITNPIWQDFYLLSFVILSLRSWSLPNA